MTSLGHERPEGSLGAGAAWQAEDGAILTYSEALLRMPAGMTEQERMDRLEEFVEPVTFTVPGERLAAVELRESILLLVIAGAAVVATMVVIQRRRPY